jgi:tetratricopeptide (TPR) repeat protein
LASTGVAAQFEDPPAPNVEPGSDETLFEQSDLGNVTQAALLAYGSGDRELQSAGKLARRATETSDPEKRESILEKRTTALQRAVEHFQEAIGYNPQLLDAYTGLGTALREQGQYGESLQIHARALQADDTREEDFRGWAESLLGLDMLGDATVTYTSLLSSRPERAAILMEVMNEWLAAKQADPGDLDPADVQRLADWIAQQEGSGG